MTAVSTSFRRMDESTAEQWAEIGRQTTEHQGRVLDVSDGGLSVTTEPEVGQGEPVRVVLRPPDMTAFEVSALAWHCRRVRQPSGKAMHVLGLMLELNRELQTSLVIVTHDHAIANRIARVLVLEDGVLKPSA